MSIELPKDAEGREIPLDTEVLYTGDGKRLDINRFTYSVVQTIPNLKWGVVFMDCAYDYCCAFYLTPPEPPDSWEKLEEDLDRCIKGDGLCAYYSPSGRCSTCILDRRDPCSCNSIVLEDIEKRIRKLRGDGK